MNPPPQFVGIMLVRNEDVFVERAVRNALEFCDRFIIADHHSTDGTFQILSRLAAEHPEKIALHRIAHPRESHDLIRPYAGTATWIFAVDGDEIYDPAGLRVLKQELLNGAHDSSWVLFGNVLNAISLDLERQEAQGYLAPPCRSMTKLFNFTAIEDWPGDCLERLHGGKIRFRQSFEANLRHDLHQELAWENAHFRCVHVCFLKRTSLGEGTAPRQNIMETHTRDPKRDLAAWARHLFRLPPDNYKDRKYRRGEPVTVDVSAFFPN